MKTALRGVFLTSENPRATATFYEQVAALPLVKVGVEGHVYWRVDTNNIQLAIHDAKAFAPYTHPARIDSNVTHLYFTIDDHEAFLRHLEHLGVPPLSADKAVITVIDPDGRKVMFGTA